MSETEEGVLTTVFVCDGIDAGHVGLVLRGVPLTEYDGEIVPGVRMTPKQARNIAGLLLEMAEDVERESV
ncbi:MAG TPA: hypothetical protein VNL17_14555 [Verrucomicrobiae bacterium]|nr:hypothetical protein [Verrucomicrobiae bacterium]